ncbi:MAG: DUF1353 domain-containing protein [Smithella sp.]
MSRFLTELDARLKPNSDSVWLIDKPLIYESDIVGPIEVPAGFETDFASVPRIPLFYTLFGDRAHREAVLHDYLFRVDSIPQATFMQANRAFLEAMEVRGKSFFVRYPMFLGVCAGGYFSFHKKNVNDKI